MLRFILQNIMEAHIVGDNSEAYLIDHYVVKAMPWLRLLLAGLSPQRPGFAPKTVHARFAVDKVALGQVSLRVLRLSPVNIIPPWLSTLIYHLGDEP
jgi:hypothetical protein